MILTQKKISVGLTTYSAIAIKARMLSCGIHNTLLFINLYFAALVQFNCVYALVREIPKRFIFRQRVVVWMPRALAVVDKVS